MERRLGSDSTTSSKPPSADPPYRKPERRSSRTASGRKPGKQPGTGGTTMPLADNPNQTLYCDVDRCGDCGGDLTGRAGGTGGAPSGHRHRRAPATTRDRVPDHHPHLPLLRERAGRCGVVQGADWRTHQRVAVACRSVTRCRPWRCRSASR